MNNVAEFLYKGQKQDIWEKYCGFLDLNPDEFVDIQKRLLLEQINLLHRSKIGKKLLGKTAPRDVDEFRKVVPLTTYEDYADELDGKKTDALPEGKYVWARTSGMTGLYANKWAPYSERMYKCIQDMAVGALILCSCSYRGEVKLESKEVMLLAAAPPPYISGVISSAINEMGIVRFVPSIEEGKKMEFNERISEGFNQAMALGLDYFFGLATVLTKIGERFESGSSGSGFSRRMLNPSILFRLIKGTIIASLSKRRMLPRDIWKVKGVVTGGTDNEVYREPIKHYWGKMPMESYACTEGSLMACQSWSYKGMNFFPECDFLEFIPYEDHIKNKMDPNYIPETRLYNELEPGIYEIVFSNLMGGVFTRYRVGDLLEVTSMRDEEAKINLPQFRFYSRCNDLIDLGGFALLNERAIWKSIEACGEPYEDWFARKEIERQEVYLHLYIEFKNNEDLQLEDIATKIHQGLKIIVPDFADMENILGSAKIKLTALPQGSWASYIQFQSEAGAEIAHIKPPHIQPSEETVRRMMTVVYG